MAEPSSGTHRHRLGARRQGHPHQPARSWCERGDLRVDGAGARVDEDGPRRVGPLRCGGRTVGRRPPVPATPSRTAPSPRRHLAPLPVRKLAPLALEEAAGCSTPATGPVPSQPAATASPRATARGTATERGARSAASTRGVLPVRGRHRTVRTRSRSVANGNPGKPGIDCPPHVRPGQPPTAPPGDRARWGGGPHMKAACIHPGDTRRPPPGHPTGPSCGRRVQVPQTKEHM